MSPTLNISRISIFLVSLVSGHWTLRVGRLSTNIIRVPRLDQGRQQLCSALLRPMPPSSRAHLHMAYGLWNLPLEDRCWENHGTPTRTSSHPSQQLYGFGPKCMWPLDLWEGLEDTGWVGLGEQTPPTQPWESSWVGCRHFSVSALKPPACHPLIRVL